MKIMLHDKISPIKNRLDIDKSFLQQAWRNVHFEEQSSLQGIVNFCHQQPFYHDYTDHLINNKMSLDRATQETETMAMGMLNLLYNPHLEPEVRKSISQSVILRLKFGLEMGAASENNDVHIHHEELDIQLPSHAHDLINQIIGSTKNAYHAYLDNKKIPEPLAENGL